MQRVNAMGTITKDDVITIGQLAARTGVAVSASSTPVSRTRG